MPPVGSFYSRPDVIEKLNQLAATSGSGEEVSGGLRLLETEELFFRRLRDGGAYEASTEIPCRLRSMMADLLTDPVLLAKHSIDEIVDTVQGDLQREYDQWISLLWTVRCLVIDPVMRAKTAGLPLDVRTVAESEIRSARMLQAFARNNFGAASSDCRCGSGSGDSFAVGVNVGASKTEQFLAQQLETANLLIAELQSRLEAHQQ